MLYSHQQMIEVPEDTLRSYLNITQQNIQE